MGALGRYRRKILKARGKPGVRKAQSAKCQAPEATRQDWRLLAMAYQVVDLFRIKRAAGPAPKPDFATRKQG